MKLYIGENLKRLRNEKNITQEMIAEYLGVTFQAVSRWENGLAYPDIEFLPELARFFEVSLEELMGTESDEERIRKTVNECYLLSEIDKSAALIKLHDLEREYPVNWYIKQAICRVLVSPKPQSYEEVLPELRRYAVEGMKKCTMKDAWYFRYIISTLVKAVPEEELADWAKYIPSAHNPNYNTILAERYRERNNPEKARYYTGEAVQANLMYLCMEYMNLGTSAEETIISREYANAAINAVVGEPYKKDNKVHNSIMLWERAANQIQIAAGYAGCDQTERGLAELEKAVDLWVLWGEALYDDYFTSDSPYLHDIKNQRSDQLNNIEFVIDALTNTSEWAWFNSIRDDSRFSAQLDRLKAKKAELEEYFADHLTDDNPA